MAANLNLFNPDDLTNKKCKYKSQTFSNWLLENNLENAMNSQENKLIIKQINLKFLFET